MRKYLHLLFVFCFWAVGFSSAYGSSVGVSRILSEGYSVDIRPTTDSLASNSLEETTIGERTIFNVELQFPDGTVNTDVSLDIDIPDGMMFLLTDFSPSAYQQFPENKSVSGAYLSVNCGGGSPFGGIIEKMQLNQATDHIENGSDITLDLGTVEVFNDGQNDNNHFCIDIQTIALNVDSNFGKKDHQKIFIPSVIERTSQGLRLESQVKIPTIEPSLETYDSLISAREQAENRWEYVLYVGHGKLSLANAFDTRISFQLDPRLTLDTDFGSDGLDNDSDGLIDSADQDEVSGAFFRNVDSDFPLYFDWNSTHNGLFDDLPLDKDIILRFKVTSDENVSESDSFHNKVSTEWRSVFPDQFGSQRDYRSTEFFPYPDTVRLGISSSADGELSTNFPDATIGETVNYRAFVTLPEASNPYFEFFFEGDGVDFVFDPTFARFDTTCGRKKFSGSLPSFTQWDIHHDREYNPDKTVKKTHTSTSFEFDGNIDIPMDGDPSNNTFCILYSAHILDDSDSVGLFGNQSVLSHFITVEVDPTNEELDTASMSVNVVEPDLYITTHIGTDDVGGDVRVGDTLLFRIDVAHGEKSMMEAKNLNIATDMDERLTVLTHFGSDGLDNDGDGLVDNDDPEEVNGTFFGYFDQTDNAFRFSGSTTDNPKLAKLLRGENISFQFYVQVNDKARDGDVFSQTAWLSYENLFLNGNNGNVHRAYQKHATLDISVKACPFDIFKPKFPASSPKSRPNIRQVRTPFCLRSGT